VSDKEYNGWTNYDTWLLKLNCDNDYGLYEYMREYVQDYYSKKHALSVGQLGFDIKEMLGDMFYNREYNVYKICDSWTQRDWDNIDWYQIADAYIQDELLDDPDISEEEREEILEVLE